MKNGKIILITILQPHAPSLFQYLQIGLDLVYMTHKSNFYPNPYTSISTYQKKKKKNEYKPIAMAVWENYRKKKH